MVHIEAMMFIYISRRAITAWRVLAWTLLKKGYKIKCIYNTIKHYINTYFINRVVTRHKMYPKSGFRRASNIKLSALNFVVCIGAKLHFAI